MEIIKNQRLFRALIALVLIYVGCVSFLNTHRARFQLQSIQTERIVSLSQYDTQVNIVVNDNRWFFTRWSEGTHIKMKNHYVRYVNEKGHILKASEEQVPCEFKLKPNGKRCFITYQFSLKDIPQSAKSVIFSSAIAFNDLGKDSSTAVKMPIRVELRHK